MPKNLPVDKSQLKAAFCKGIPLTDLAKQFNINVATIRSMSVRGKWRIAKAKTEELVHQVALDAGIKHVSDVASQVKERLAELATFKFGEALNKLDAEGYVRSLNTLDLIARRAYRLDDAQKRSQTLVTVNVNSESGGGVKLANIVDVDTVVSDADSQICENSQH
jgi:hypothetical protein